MQGKTMMMKLNQYLASAAILASAVLVGGCGATFVNLTAVNQSQNPSGIYTMQTEVDIQDKAVVNDTVQVSLVIGAESHPMVRGQISDSIWSYDYKLPKGYRQANYYFVAEYQVLRENLLKPRQIKSQLYRFQLENRYVGNLLAYRAPVGRKISVQGRGFTKYDQVQFGPEIAITKLISENELQFVVPSLPSGVDYPLEVIGSSKLPIGNFRIDESIMEVDPKILELDSGDIVQLLFAIDFEAPPGGLGIKVETDVTGLIVMNEVRIAEGDLSVSAQLKGGTPGKGNVFITVPGIKEVVVPITVRGDEPEITPTPAPAPAPAPEPSPLPPLEP